MWRSIKSYLISFRVFLPLPLQGMWLAYLPIRMYYHGSHEPETTIYFKQVVKKDWVAVDVGAYVGYYTVLFSKLANKVYAFEPSEISFRKLKRNVAYNRCKNVGLYNAAIGEKGKTATLHGTQRGGADSLSITQGATYEKIVQVLSLDGIIRGRVDVVKIDAEGADLDVLEGMKRIMQENPNLTITLEFSPKNISKSGGVPADFLHTVEGYGLTLQWIAPGGIISDDIEYLRNLKAGHVNLLCKPKGK